MNDKQFELVTNFFVGSLECDEHYGRKLAGYVDNIISYSNAKDSDVFIYTVACGIRNAYWDGQMNAIFDDEWSK